MGDMAWPRLNNFSFWMLLPASMCLAWGLLQGGVGSRWTIYPPLSALETPMDAMIFSLHLAGISSILGAINFLTTILMNGPKGFCLYNLYLYLYCMGVTVFMLLTTLPVLAAGITMILFDRHFNTSFFNVAGGRDPILFQHLFWFFRHPDLQNAPMNFPRRAACCQFVFTLLVGLLWPWHTGPCLQLSYLPQSRSPSLREPSLPVALLLSTPGCFCMLSYPLQIVFWSQFYQTCSSH